MKKTTSLVKLYPFLHEGVLCVGGRLVHANLEDEAIYPRIVPAQSHLAELIIKNSQESPFMEALTKSSLTLDSIFEFLHPEILSGRQS